MLALFSYLVVFAVRFISGGSVIAITDIWHAVSFELTSLSYTTGGLYFCAEGDAIAHCVGILAAQ